MSENLASVIQAYSKALALFFGGHLGVFAHERAGCSNTEPLRVTERAASGLVSNNTGQPAYGPFSADFVDRL